MTVRVVVADDQDLLRAGLRGTLDSAADLTVVGEAGTGIEAVALARTESPDVVLMDVRMPDMDGIEATRLITADGDARVLILTTFDLDEYVYAALRGGASGFLLKDVRPRDLLDAVRAVARGDELLAPAITKRLIARFAGRRAGPLPACAALSTVTDREREVLTLVGRGLSNSEIARELHIGPGTAKTHVSHLLTKLDARDRVNLAIIAYRYGLVDPTSP